MAINEPRIFMNKALAGSCCQDSQGCNVLGLAEGFAIDVNVDANQQSECAVKGQPRAGLTINVERGSGAAPVLPPGWVVNLTRSELSKVNWSLPYSWLYDYNDST
jgi:hypothetical protein